MFEHVGVKNHRRVLPGRAWVPPTGWPLPAPDGRGQRLQPPQRPLVRQVHLPQRGGPVGPPDRRGDRDPVRPGGLAQFRPRLREDPDRLVRELRSSLARLEGRRVLPDWKYYLLSAAGGFKARRRQIWQILLSKGTLRTPVRRSHSATLGWRHAPERRALLHAAAGRGGCRSQRPSALGHPRPPSPGLRARALLGGSLALGEAYMDGWWDCEDLDALSSASCGGASSGRLPSPGMAPPPQRPAPPAVPAAGSPRIESVAHASGCSSRSCSARPWPTRVPTGPRLTPWTQAQRAKLDLVCRKLGIRASDRVLDLGCGFGSFARFAAENYGCSVVAVNLSSVQVTYAASSVAAFPWRSTTATTRTLDAYAQGRRFDKIVSIAMFEAVGHRSHRRAIWSSYTSCDHGPVAAPHPATDISSDPWMNRYNFLNAACRPSANSTMRSSGCSSWAGRPQLRAGLLSGSWRNGSRNFGVGTRLSPLRRALLSHVDLLPVHLPWVAAGP